MATIHPIDEHSMEIQIPTSISGETKKKLEILLRGAFQLRQCIEIYRREAEQILQQEGFTINWTDTNTSSITTIPRETSTVPQVVSQAVPQVFAQRTNVPVIATTLTQEPISQTNLVSDINAYVPQTSDQLELNIIDFIKGTNTRTDTEILDNYHQMEKLFVSHPTSPYLIDNLRLCFVTRFPKLRSLI